MNKQRQRKKRGTKWESEIAVENEQLRTEGLARIVRANEPFRVIGSDGSGSPRVVRTSKSEPDFSGLCFGGRAVAFDAKRTTSHRLGLPDPRKPDKGWWHQVEALSEFTAFGGLGFLYVLRDDLDNPFDRQRYVLPVADGLIAGHDPRVSRSVALGSLPASYRVRRGESWFDTVANNLRWWEFDHSAKTQQLR